MTILRGTVRWVGGHLALAVFLVMLTLNGLTATALVTAVLASIGVESALATVQAELKNTKTDLDAATKRTAQVEDDLGRARADLDHTRGELKTARDDLSLTQSKLQVAKEELGSARADLDRTRGQLETTQADLDRANSHIAARDAELKQQRRNVRRLTGKIARRTEAGAVRNVGFMFGESIPVYGIVVVVAATGWEIADACRTMRDMEELNSAFGISDVGVNRAKVCGLQVPTVDEVKNTIISGPGEVWAAVKENTPNLDLPEWARELSFRPIWDFITRIWPWGGEPA